MVGEHAVEASPEPRLRRRQPQHAPPPPTVKQAITTPRRKPLADVMNIATHHPPRGVGQAPASLPSTPWPRPLQELPPTASTIRHLRVAFEDTPPRLRGLEEGWRHARRRLATITATGSGKQVVFDFDPPTDHHVHAPVKLQLPTRDATEEAWSDGGAGSPGAEKRYGLPGGVGVESRRADGDDTPPPPIQLLRRTSSYKAVHKKSATHQGTHASPSGVQNTNSALPPTMSTATKTSHPQTTTTTTTEPATAVTPSTSRSSRRPALPPTPPSSPRGPMVNASTSATAATSVASTYQLSNAAASTQPTTTEAASSMPASSTAYSPNQLPNLASGPKTGAHSPPALASRASRKILPGCLPATGSIRLSKRNEDSIAIHDPPDQVGITLALDGLVVRILRTGDHAVIAGAEVSVLRLKDADKWSHADHELWRRMAADVAEYKRMTRRMTVYTSLGDVTLTCSDPPDIVLSCTLPDGPHHDYHDPKGKVNVTKARVRYSFSINEMVLDTASRRASGELHKTKRLVPLRHRHIAPDRQSPYKAKEKEKAKDKDAVEAAAAALGVVVGPDWSVAEREAVRRLWATRVQWGQYVIAANEDKL